MTRDLTYCILLFYYYGAIAHPEKLMDEQRLICSQLDLKGRMIIAREGFNATLEGTAEHIAQYIDAIKGVQEFSNIHFKLSEGTGNAFPRLSIKVRNEIVTSHLDGAINPAHKTGSYLSPEELHEWFVAGEEFYIVDMRNGYEQRVGFFERSLLSEFAHFSDLPSILPKLESLRGKKILTVCTGGVRCEKASAFLLENGFPEVYQLYGGIVSYMEKYPNEHFKGKLYVFDGRVCMGFNTSDPAHTIVGRCQQCHAVSERYINCANDACHRHYISCPACSEAKMGCCSDACNGKMHAVVGS